MAVGRPFLPADIQFLDEESLTALERLAAARVEQDEVERSD
jgi:hypothetical protein